MKAKYIVIGLVVVLVLGSAAFVAARLLQNPAQVGNGIKRGISASGDSVVSGVEFELDYAPELPATPSEAGGMLARVEGNSLFITQYNNVGAVMGYNKGSEIIIPTPEGGGTEIEVVVTKDTQIYHDITQLPSLREGEELPDVIQQKVEPITLNDIGDQGSLVVWGQRRGDRIVADAVVYYGY